MNENVEFSADFLDSLAPGNTDDCIKYEICVGCENRFVDGSEGSGSIEFLTYCSDCYPKERRENSNTSDMQQENIYVDLTHKTEEIIDSDLLNKNYGEKVQSLDCATFENYQEMFEHLIAINQSNSYSVQFKVCKTKLCEYQMLPKSGVKSHTVLFLCLTILQPLLYW